MDDSKRMTLDSATALAQRFPADFVFGVATAAYQIEGAAREDGRKPSIWDAYSHMPGRVFQGHSGDIACDHYHRLDADLDLIKSLGVDAYRFSIAWPRVIPDGRGAINEKGLDFYDRLIDGLIARDIQVFPTLYHWDLPLLLQGYGGWTDRDTAEAFADYTTAVVKRLGDRIDALVTFNEPWCSCYLGHLYGQHAPGERNLQAAMESVHTTNLAHGLGVQAARAEQANLPIGIVLNAVSIRPGSDSEADIDAAERAFQFNNGVFFGPLFNAEYDEELMSELGEHLPIQADDLQTINQPLDFWGFNYYFPGKAIDARKPGSVFPHVKQINATDSKARTDIGWEIDASGMAYLLEQVYARYDNLPPCYITENGACYNMGIDKDGAIDDQPRLDYLDDHINVVADMIGKGIDMRGYFAWSLMDNFEWAEGYKMRFGITHVDYETQERTVKKSGRWYAHLCNAHHSRAATSNQASS